MAQEKLAKINAKQRLYVLHCGSGYTCLGFDVCQQWSVALACELDVRMPKVRKGTKAAYKAYETLVGIAGKRHLLSGWRSKSELTPWLIGHEDELVEVVTEWGERVRFRVGRSNGFIPVHIQLDEKYFDGSRWRPRWDDDDGVGGAAVCVGAPRSVKFLAPRSRLEHAG